MSTTQHLPISQKPFYTSNGWGVRQPKIQIYTGFIETQHKQYEHNIEWPPSSYRKYNVILKTQNALLCVAGIHITQSKRSG